MSIKNKVIKKISYSKKDIISIEGINGSGKTTFLKKILKKNLSSLQYYLWLIYYFKKSDTLLNTTINLKIRKYKLFVENMFLFNVIKKNIIQEMEDFSSGQKKKKYLSGFFSNKSYYLYVDEAKNYLDDISYKKFKKKVIKHLTISGNVVISSNSKQKFEKYIKKKVSLSRFELLTFRLSSDCSKPTEL